MSDLNPHETANFPIDPADLIAGLGRGLLVIESFDNEHPRMNATQVSQRTGIPRTAARRHLLSLCHFGFAQTDGKHFWLTPRILRLGQSYLESARLPRVVQPYLQHLSTVCGETANVSVLDGQEVVYISRSNSPRLVSIGFHAGARAPAHTVAPGYILLSRLSEAQLQAWVARHHFTTFTANALTDAEVFMQQVREARSLNHWIAQGQLDPGLVGVSVPLQDRQGRCVAAMGMTLQVSNWPHHAITEQLVPQLLRTTQALRSVL
jgi:IclR family transcriptional regulator, pca regulon regulatory protein